MIMPYTPTEVRASVYKTPIFRLATAGRNQPPKKPSVVASPHGTIAKAATAGIKPSKGATRKTPLSASRGIINSLESSFHGVGNWLKQTSRAGAVWAIAQLHPGHHLAFGPGLVGHDDQYHVHDNEQGDKGLQKPDDRFLGNASTDFWAGAAT